MMSKVPELMQKHARTINLAFGKDLCALAQDLGVTIIQMKLGRKEITNGSFLAWLNRHTVLATCPAFYLRPSFSMNVA